MEDEPSESSVLCPNLSLAPFAPFQVECIWPARGCISFRLCRLLLSEPCDPATLALLERHSFPCCIGRCPFPDTGFPARGRADMALSL